MKITVFATFDFAALHCWPDAPTEVDYLRSPHRHLFHVRMEKTVTHLDRDVEIIALKNSGQKFCEDAARHGDVLTWSCEQWAATLLTLFNLSRCEVSEDAENGAFVETC